MCVWCVWYGVCVCGAVWYGVCVCVVQCGMVCVCVWCSVVWCGMVCMWNMQCLCVTLHVVFELVRTLVLCVHVGMLLDL